MGNLSKVHNGVGLALHRDKFKISNFDFIYLPCQGQVNLWHDNIFKQGVATPCKVSTTPTMGYITTLGRNPTQNSHFYTEVTRSATLTLYFSGNNNRA